MRGITCFRADFAWRRDLRNGSKADTRLEARRTAQLASGEPTGALVAISGYARSSLPSVAERSLLLVPPDAPIRTVIVMRSLAVRRIVRPLKNQTFHSIHTSGNDWTCVFSPSPAGRR
jgi:hypothetical protein